MDGLNRMMGREALTAAVEKSITILNTSLNASQDSLVLQTLQVLRRFLAELERIDKEAQQAAGECFIHVTAHLPTLLLV